MEEFLSSWYGILTLVLFDVVAIFAIVCITYRWLFKRIFDFLFSLICTVLLSPLFIYILVRANGAKKRGEIAGVTRWTAYAKKNGKTVKLSAFESRNEAGELAGSYGEWLEKTKLFALAGLLDVLVGKRSFIGLKAFTRGETAFLDEVQADRLIAKTGLINPLVVCGDADTDYAEMLESDQKYAWNFSFFGDCKIFFTWLLGKIRGESNEYLGKTRERSFLDYLLERGKITQAEYAAAKE